MTEMTEVDWGNFRRPDGSPYFDDLVADGSPRKSSLERIVIELISEPVSQDHSAALKTAIIERGEAEQQVRNALADKLQTEATLGSQLSALQNALYDKDRTIASLRNKEPETVTDWTYTGLVSVLALVLAVALFFK